MLSSGGPGVRGGAGGIENKAEACLRRSSNVVCSNQGHMQIQDLNRAGQEPEARNETVGEVGFLGLSLKAQNLKLQKEKKRFYNLGK